MAGSNDFFFETALEHRMAVVIHTGAGAPFSLPSLCMAPARKFPALTVVVAHCGGGIYVHEAILAATICPNIILELSSLMPHQVLEVLAHVPAERIMIGSDLPENISTEIGKILTLAVSDEQKRSILCTTGCRVFGS
jgi:predicted TIM-barrel fold metal-dependent hydrolase